MTQEDCILGLPQRIYRQMSKLVFSIFFNPYCSFNLKEGICESCKFQELSNPCKLFFLPKFSFPSKRKCLCLEKIARQQNQSLIHVPEELRAK